jgi:LysR family glycine cleavage system transcriptional activator
MVMTRSTQQLLGKEPLSTKLLPNSLAVFEAVARLGSIAAAASHLNVAASAVSRHMANLEGRLSLELFARNGNRLTLTADGADLAAAVRDGLSTIQDRIAGLQLKRSGTVVLGCSADAAAFWVMPRFDRIAAQFDLDNFRMMTSSHYADFDDPSVDLSIRYGVPDDWPGFVATPLFPGSFVAVCAPSLLERFPDLASGSTEALMCAPLLHMGFVHDGLEDWSEWLEAPVKLPGPRFTNFQAMTQAAIAGYGVGIDYGNFCDAAIRDGRLVRVGEVHAKRATHHLLHRPPERPATRLLARILSE